MARGRVELESAYADEPARRVLLGSIAGRDSSRAIASSETAVISEHSARHHGVAFAGQCAAAHGVLLLLQSPGRPNPRRQGEHTRRHATDVPYHFCIIVSFLGGTHPERGVSTEGH